MCSVYRRYCTTFYVLYIMHLLRCCNDIFFDLPGEGEELEKSQTKNTPKDPSVESIFLWKEKGYSNAFVD